MGCCATADDLPALAQDAQEFIIFLLNEISETLEKQEKQRQDHLYGSSDTASSSSGGASPGGMAAMQGARSTAACSTGTGALRLGIWCSELLCKLRQPAAEADYGSSGSSNSSGNAACDFALAQAKAGACICNTRSAPAQPYQRMLCMPRACNACLLHAVPCC